jgi:hypothetical protein
MSVRNSTVSPTVSVPCEGFFGGVQHGGGHGGGEGAAWARGGARARAGAVTRAGSGPRRAAPRHPALGPTRATPAVHSSMPPLIPKNMMADCMTLRTLREERKEYSAGGGMGRDGVERGEVGTWVVGGSGQEGEAMAALHWRRHQACGAVPCRRAAWRHSPSTVLVVVDRAAVAVAAIGASSHSPSPSASPPSPPPHRFGSRRSRRRSGRTRSARCRST